MSPVQPLLLLTAAHDTELAVKVAARSVALTDAKAAARDRPGYHTELSVQLARRELNNAVAEARKGFRVIEGTPKC